MESPKHILSDAKYKGLIQLRQVYIPETLTE